MDTNEPAPHFIEASQWEVSRTLSAERSERRAWIVASLFGSGFVMACGAIMLMMPLKQTTPYVIRVDNATGVPDIVTAMEDQVITGDDAMDKHWLARYVTHRETYDWYTLQNDYDTVGLMSSPAVGSEYGEQFTGPDALQDKYRDQIRATIQVVSVVPSGNNTGTVRFVKTTKRTRTDSKVDTSRWIATIAFEYQNNERMKESVRLVNPFGFRVTSYRIDPELVGDN